MEINIFELSNEHSLCHVTLIVPSKIFQKNEWNPGYKLEKKYRQFMLKSCFADILVKIQL